MNEQIVTPRTKKETSGAPSRAALRILTLLILMLGSVLAGLFAGTRIGAAKLSAQEQASADARASEILHPDFSYTRGDFPDQIDAILSQLSEQLPDSVYQEIRADILARPQVFLQRMEQVLNDTDPMFYVLADKEHSLSSDYAPEDLVSLSRYSDILALNREDLSLREVVIPPLMAMTEAAAQEGIRLDISSSYRSYQYQAGLFQRYSEKYGEAEAARFSARPGTSQHQLGTTMDFGSVTVEFADTAAGRWLAANAWRYGFSLSYPDGFENVTGYIYEPWHFRYMGDNLLFLQREFFLDIQQYMLLFINVAADPMKAAMN